MNYKIKEISQIVNGSTPSTSNSAFWNGNIIWITPKDLTNFSERYIYKGHINITQEGYKSCSTKLVPKGTILLSSRAPIGYIAIAGNELCTNQGFKSIICNEKVNNFYLYYWLLKNVDYLKSISSGATFKELSKDTLENVEINLPSLTEQQHIVNTIGSIDDLIENYDKQLEKIKIILRDKYKSYDNLNKIKLGDVATIKTGKLNADACCQNGIYPFFTCSEKPLNINVYAFDGPSILLSGNGSQLGYLNFYDGKFNAYQRTYVIQSNKIYSIYASLLCNIDQIINQACGSAIPYITKPMIENLYIFEFDKITEKIFKILIVKMQHINKEKSLLIKLKQTLLNKYFTNQ